MTAIADLITVSGCPP